MFILCFGAVWPEIADTVGVMTRVGAASLELVSSLVLDCLWGWGFGLDCFETECTMSQPGLK